MYHILYEYLVLHRQLVMPGTGVFSLQARSAETDFTHKLIHAPSYSFAFNQADKQPDKNFMHWLAEKSNLPFDEAAFRFNGFASELKTRLMQGDSVKWPGLGTLNKGLGGELIFETIMNQERFDPPVGAARVIRDKAEHNVRVGEQDKTSVEMTEWLNNPGGKRSRWWVTASIATVLLIIISGLYFSQHGCNASSLANQQKLAPEKARITNQSIP